MTRMTPMALIQQWAQSITGSLTGSLAHEFCGVAVSGIFRVIRVIVLLTGRLRDGILPVIDVPHPPF